ncbi:MAG: DUF58 domain-containing protein [Flavobacteriales bacterium]|nr:DUF58 domain-containing protein [Flavobacteriales bacterium]
MFVLSFIFPVLFYAVYGVLFALVLAALGETVVLYISPRITGFRDVASRMSNGDDNSIYIHITNQYGFKAKISLIDEVPFQFQVRDKTFELSIAPDEVKTIHYTLRPVERGAYHFGKINVFVSTPLQLIQRRYQLGEDQMVPVYPSFLQVNKYQLMAISNNLPFEGIKKIRKIGQNYEFDQVRNYVIGDDYRKINWSATARKGDLMVSQYEDEKSQNVYAVINMGRTMKMPFNKMTLLDHAINSSLIVLNNSIIKSDRAGLITFTNKIGTVLRASNKTGQINKIMETLYQQSTDFKEADYEMLYFRIRKELNQRSLLFLYTNFENMTSLKREMQFLKSISKYHLLVVIFFENTELDALSSDRSGDLEEVYVKTIAKKFKHEKELIDKELRNYGIQTILTTPENLTIDSINKYLELKSRGMI